MKNYLISSADAAEKLTEASVSFCEFSHAGEAGVLIEEGDLTVALEALRASVSAEKTTELEGVIALNLAPADETGLWEVTIASWEGDGDKIAFVDAASTLAGTIQKDVVFHVPHGKNSRPVDDGDFHIHIWSSLEGRAKSKETSEEIWGIPVACRDAGFFPSGQGVGIYDGNYAVAEIVGDNLYIHHDICHTGRESEAELFSRLLEEVIAEINLTPGEKEERARDRAHAERAANRGKYIAECNGRFKKTIRGTREAILKGKKDCERLTAELTRRIRETRGAERKLQQMENCRPEELEKYGQEYDRLLQLPKVEKVEVANGVVKVFTDVLFATDDRSGKVHEIGRFRIEIFTSGANNGVRWFNLDRKVDAYWGDAMAPHINGSGSACFGNTSATFAELIAEFEFAVTAMVAIEFVETANTSDPAGAKVNLWPVAEKDEAAA